MPTANNTVTYFYEFTRMVDLMLSALVTKCNNITNIK